MPGRVPAPRSEVGDCRGTNAGLNDAKVGVGNPGVPVLDVPKIELVTAEEDSACPKAEVVAAGVDPPPPP
jgi:hypothetical protein